jgi:dTMP kinase
MQLSKMLFVVDGPNGVGKSRVIEELKKQVIALELSCVFTKEPSNSFLGNFIRQHDDIYTAQTLAALIAADRYDHIEKVITPNISMGKFVVSDRYFCSSLVYQILDGLDYKFIENLNAKIILPKHYFILTASLETIALRQAERKSPTRFESQQLLNKEIELFRNAGRRLQELGVMVHFLENDATPPEATANIICEKILEYNKGNESNKLQVQ